MQNLSGHRAVSDLAVDSSKQTMLPGSITFCQYLLQSFTRCTCSLIRSESRKWEGSKSDRFIALNRASFPLFLITLLKVIRCLCLHNPFKLVVREIPIIVTCAKKVSTSSIVRGRPEHPLCLSKTERSETAERHSEMRCFFLLL